MNQDAHSQRRQRKPEGTLMEPMRLDHPIFLRLTWNMVVSYSSSMQSRTTSLTASVDSVVQVCAGALEIFVLANLHGDGCQSCPTVRSSCCSSCVEGCWTSTTQPGKSEKREQGA